MREIRPIRPLDSGRFKSKPPVEEPPTKKDIESVEKAELRKKIGQRLRELYEALRHSRKISCSDGSIEIRLIRYDGKSIRCPCKSEKYGKKNHEVLDASFRISNKQLSQVFSYMEMHFLCVGSAMNENIQIRWEQLGRILGML